MLLEVGIYHALFSPLGRRSFVRNDVLQRKDLLCLGGDTMFGSSPFFNNFFFKTLMRSVLKFSSEKRKLMLQS